MKPLTLCCAALAALIGSIPLTNAQNLRNLSVRAQVLDGDDIVIGGFIIEGTQPKTVVIQGLGPSMATAGVSDTLDDPVLTLFSGPTPLASNDDWQSGSAAAAITAADLAPVDPRESALLMTLDPGPYTAQVQGKDGAQGIGMVAIYAAEPEAENAHLSNISGRVYVGTGEQVAIGGFIIGGQQPLQIAMRGQGPSLEKSGINDSLIDPELLVYSGQNLIAASDDWLSGVGADTLNNIGLAPSDEKEAAALLTLLPGGYTIILRGRNAGMGVGLVDINLVSAVAPATCRLHGMNFGPYLFPGQGPATTADPAQLEYLLDFLSPYTQWIRTFGLFGMEQIGAMIHARGMKAAVGAWLSADLAANDREVQALINAGKRGEVDQAVLGGEVLLRGDLSENQLIQYIQQVQQALPGIPVAYADGYSVLLDHPRVIQAVDVLHGNFYPYWEGIGIDQAINRLATTHQQLVAAAGGKPVWVGETGWPSSGEVREEAVPSSENAATYLRDFVAWASAQQVEYLYFEAFDEPWKVANEGVAGAHWGLWDTGLNFKPGVQDLFAGTPVNGACTGAAETETPGDPSIEFTSVPPRGSTENLQGQVHDMAPADYRVAVYIYVSGWWTKPTFTSPLTSISADESWTTDITTGGNDQNATAIAAFLVPAGYSPPELRGAPTLPASLEAAAVAKVQVSR